MGFLPRSPRETKYRASFPARPGPRAHSWFPFPRQFGGQPGREGGGDGLVTRCPLTGRRGQSEGSGT